MERRERICTNRRTPRWIIHKALRLLREEDWSPRQISGYLRLEGLRISHERIYQIIRADETGELRKHCRHKLKYRRHKGRKRKPSGRTIIPDRVSIHQRPAEADGTRFGDWEMDLVIGKGQKSAVLTMIERKTNMFLQSKLTSKKPEVVAMAAWRLLLPYKANVLTITTDNGSEFMNHQCFVKVADTKQQYGIGMFLFHLDVLLHKWSFKLVKRGITELVTPGVSINDTVLNHKENNFVAALHAKAR